MNSRDGYYNVLYAPPPNTRYVTRDYIKGHTELPRLVGGDEGRVGAEAGGGRGRVRRGRRGDVRGVGA